MREFKFRAWDKENLEMFDVAYIQIQMERIKQVGIIGFRLLPERKRTSYGNGKSNRIYYPHFELMQYTGLKDKNAKMIFEGDIVEWPDSEPNIDWYGKVIGQVIWQNGAFFVTAKGDFSSWLHDLGELEVINNIYENKELTDSNKTTGLLDDN